MDAVFSNVRRYLRRKAYILALQMQPWKRTGYSVSTFTYLHFGRDYKDFGSK